MLDAAAPTAPAPVARVGPLDPTVAVTAALAPHDKTIELSASDLTAAEPSLAAPPPVSETSHHAPPPARRRPSLIPLIAVLVFAGIAVKLALDAQAPAVTAPVNPAPPRAPASASAASSLDPTPLTTGTIADAAVVDADAEPDANAAEIADASPDAHADASADALDHGDDADADATHPTTSGTTQLPPPPRPRPPPSRPKPPPRHRPR